MTAKREAAVAQYIQEQCQKRVLQNLIEKIFISSSLEAMYKQIAAISKSIEMCSNKIDKYIVSK